MNGRSLGIASDLLTASNLSEREAQRIAESLWRIVKNYKPNRQWFVVAPIVFIGISGFVEKMFRKADWVSDQLGVDVPIGVDFAAYPPVADRYSHALDCMVNSAEGTPQHLLIARASWDFISVMWTLCELGINDGH